MATLTYKSTRDCAADAKRAVLAHERKMHPGKRPTFRAKRRSSRR